MGGSLNVPYYVQMCQPGWKYADSVGQLPVSTFMGLTWADAFTHSRGGKRLVPYHWGGNSRKELSNL
jgi:hypothetical protein